MVRTILISQPNLYNYTLYLPYIYAVLKTAVEQDPELSQAYDWAWPIFYNQSPEEMYEPYKDTSIDVLGLSCYTWNSEKNYALAALVRQDNPDCLIVAGGPDPDFKDRDVYAKTGIDFIVRQDGEIAFSDILRERLKENPDYYNIPGVLGPRTEDAQRVNLSKPTDFSISPYIAQTEFFREVMARHTWDKRQEYRIYWETDRGCPYKCNFCDWGSNTMSKIRRFPMSRIQAEIDWMAANDIKFIHLTNANWGILPQDVEISKLLVENKRKNGLPRKMYYSAAKNNIKRVVDAAKILFDGGMIDHHTMGIQHTDPVVLDNMDRSNLPVETQMEIAQQLQDHGLPVLVQMIFGGPGDTPDKWAKALTDIMEMDIHEEYRCYAFNLLPNAPAAEVAHVKKHEIRAVPRYTYTVRRKKNSKPEAWSKTDYIIGTTSYGEADWVEMYMFDSFISAFHNSGITQFISRYLHDEMGVSYYDFYTNLFKFLKECSILKPTFDDMYAHLAVFASDAGSEAIEEMDIPEVNAHHLYRPNEFLLYRALVNMPELTNLLGWFLIRNRWWYPEMQDLLDWTDFLIITPEYTPEEGRVILLDYNWPEYWKTGILSSEGAMFKVGTHQDKTGTHLDIPLTWKNHKDYTETIIGTDYVKSRRVFLQEFELL